MTGPYEMYQPFEDPDSVALERRAHRKARALMLAVTLLAALALLAATLWLVPALL